MSQVRGALKILPGPTHNKKENVGLAEKTNMSGVAGSPGPQPVPLVGGPIVMATRIYVHCLSAPASIDASDGEKLLHREIPGWGIMQSTACIADAALLLIADELQVDSPWTPGAPEAEACFRDSEELMADLADKGLVTRVDSASAASQSSELIAGLVQEGLSDFEPWLRAQRESATEWTEQEALVERLWQAASQGRPAWREFLRQTGLATVKHNYRNQNQAITALVALSEWVDDHELDPAMVRDAIGSELSYVYTSVSVAAQAAAIPHDWSDYLPLYRRLAAPQAQPILSLRLPGLKAAPEEGVDELLASPELSAARRLTAAALAGESVSGADIERELLRAIPRECRAPYAYRQVSFYAYAPEFAARIGLPQGGMFANSKWRVTGLPQN